MKEIDETPGYLEDTKSRKMKQSDKPILKDDQYFEDFDQVLIRDGHGTGLPVPRIFVPET